MKLSDVISKDVPVLDKDRPLLDALEVLNEQEYESICIDEGGKMVGSISYRDILFRIGAQRLR
ncbi:MAG TPA: CBS domain-containing protein, partial [Candidatus Methanomethylicus sp.]|nr:CBS domain-containing protein [Candidatus Methanomethylicus sp.]